MKAKYLILLPMLLPAVSMAEVSVKNGNYTTNFRDYQFDTAHKFKFDRTYNSKTAKVGWFGYGWGSLFETYITVMPDGSAIITENGTGTKTLYYPAKVDVNEGVKKIISVIKEKDHLNDEQAQKLAAELKNDEYLREIKVRNYQIKTALADASNLKQEGCSYGYLQKTSTGFKRFNCYNNTNDYFDQDGHLTQVQYPDGYLINMSYVDANPSLLKDNEGNVIEFKNNSDHFVIELKKGNKKTSYEYSNKNLVKHIDDNGLEYGHDYDSNHNMIKIIYADQSTYEITYDSPESASVIAVKNRNGAVTKYQYNVISEEKDQQQTIVTHFDNAGNEIDKQTYNLDFDKSKTGARKLAAYGIQEDSGSKSSKKFDSEGRVIEAGGPNGIVNKYKYDEITKKLLELTQGDKITKFFYDKNLNLIKAENNQGLSLNFEYMESSDLIKQVTINDHQTVREASFEYGSDQKPTLLKVKNVGDIKIAYDSNGEILKVSSDQGAKVALEVTNIFNLILEVTKVE